MWVISRERLLQPASPTCNCAQSLFNGCKRGSFLLSLFYGCKTTIRRSLEKLLEREANGAWVWLTGDKRKEVEKER